MPRFFYGFHFYFSPLSLSFSLSPQSLSVSWCAYRGYLRTHMHTARHRGGKRGGQGEGWARTSSCNCLTSGQMPESAASANQSRAQQDRCMHKTKHTKKTHQQHLEGFDEKHARKIKCVIIISYKKMNTN